LRIELKARPKTQIPRITTQPAEGRFNSTHSTTARTTAVP
jgi:hypothetical protein